MRRSTLIVAGLFVLALVGLLLVRRNPEILQTATPTPMATAMAKLLPEWNDQDVVETTLSTSGGEETNLARNPDLSWNNSAAGTVGAGKVEQLLSELLATNILLTLPADTSLDDLQLTAPAQTITLTAADGRKTVIQVGMMTPTQSGYYVKVDDAAPVVVSKYAIEAVVQLFAEALPTPTETPTA